MLTLAIDTATEVLAVALGKDGNEVEEVFPRAGKRHLEMLLPEIHGILSRNGFSVADIDNIVVGTGPGTFSGLRVGISTARALAQSLGVPLFPSSTLRALAAGMVERQGAGNVPSRLVLPVIDAKRGEVFAQLYGIELFGNGFAPLSEIVCMKPDDLLACLPCGLTGRSTILAAGNGLLAHFGVFLNSRKVMFADRIDSSHAVRARFHLEAAEKGKLAEEAADAGFADVVPTYVRNPDADKTALLRKKEPWLR